MYSPSRRHVVCVLLALSVVLPSVAAAHGGFSVILLSGDSAAEGVPEPYDVQIGTSGEDEVPEQFRSQEIDVELELMVDGETVKTRSLQMGYMAAKNLQVSYTHSEPGTHEVATNVTFSLGGGEWTRESRSVRTVEVVAAGTPEALSACKEFAGDDLLPPYQLQCHLTHQGLAGFVPGFAASPLLLVALVVLGGGLGVAAFTFVGDDPLGLLDLI